MENLRPERSNLPSKNENILIVDADPTSSQQVAELIRSAGYQVATVSSHGEASQFVRELSADLLLLTADIADIQCCDTLAEIKGNARTADTRVILLIRGGGAERARGLELGADEVLSLPWEPANCWRELERSSAEEASSRMCGGKCALPMKDGRWRRRRFRPWRLPRR